jgi:hypothetical protein
VNDQLSQVKLAFDVILGIMGLLNMSVKTATSFSPFQLIYGLEAVLPIECQITSLKLVVQLLLDTSPLEEWLLYLERLNE